MIRLGFRSSVRCINRSRRSTAAPPTQSRSRLSMELLQARRGRLGFHHAPSKRGARGSRVSAAPARRAGAERVLSAGGQSEVFH